TATFIENRRRTTMNAPFRPRPAAAPERRPLLTRRRLSLLAGLLLLLLLAAVAYALTPDRQMAKVKQLRGELFGDAARSLPPEQRGEMDLYRRMMDQRRRERGLPTSPGRPR